MMAGQLLRRQSLVLLLVFLCRCQLVSAWENGLARTPVRKVLVSRILILPAALLILALIVALLTSALLPFPAQVMGWATWNAFHRHFTEQDFYDAADLMAANGMQAAGYEYINVVGLPPVSITLLPRRCRPF